MKTLLITFTISIIANFCSAQDPFERNTDKYCECFDEPKAHEIKKCIRDSDRLNELQPSLESPYDQIEFIAEISENCDNFKTYFKDQLYQKDNYSDHEYTGKIYEMLSYFKNDSLIEIPTRTVQLESNNSGLIFNVFLNKVRSDTILESGIHIVEHQDSVIVYEKVRRGLTINDVYKSTEGKQLEIAVALNYRLKTDSLYELWRDIGSNYEKMVIIPAVKSLISQKYSLIDSARDESNNIPEKVNLLSDSQDLGLKYDYFIFEELQILSVGQKNKKTVPKKNLDFVRP